MRGKTDANGLAAQATSRWPPATFPSLFPRNRVAFWSSSKALKSSISGGGLLLSSFATSCIRSRVFSPISGRKTTRLWERETNSGAAFDLWRLATSAGAPLYLRNGAASPPTPRRPCRSPLIRIEDDVGPRFPPRRNKTRLKIIKAQAEWFFFFLFFFLTPWKVGRVTWSRSWVKCLKINVSRLKCWASSWLAFIKSKAFGNKKLWVQLKYFLTLENKALLLLLFFIRGVIFLNTNSNFFVLF